MKTWTYSILTNEPKHVKGSVEMGDMSERIDVIQQLRRMGIGGEILSIAPA